MDKCVLYNKYFALNTLFPNDYQGISKNIHPRFWVLINSWGHPHLWSGLFLWLSSFWARLHFDRTKTGPPMTLPIVPPMGYPRGPMIGLPMHCNFLANTDRHTHTQRIELYIYMAHRKVNSPEHLKNGEIFF